MGSSSDRDFLLHLETFLAKRDGVDKLLKLLRYTTKLLYLTTPPQTITPRLRSFDSSLGTARKAFRLGKFIQSLYALRASPLSPPSALAYAGEGVYYFVEQFVWLSKAGLIDKRHLVWLQKVSAWAELVGCVGSIYLKVAEVKKITFLIEMVGKEEGEEVRRLREKLLIKRLSVLQDVADSVMALSDVRDGKGRFTHPVLLASAGLLSGVISAHKNWVSC